MSSYDEVIIRNLQVAVDTLMLDWLERRGFYSGITVHNKLHSACAKCYVSHESENVAEIIWFVNQHYRDCYKQWKPTTTTVSYE